MVFVPQIMHIQIKSQEFCTSEDGTSIIIMNILAAHDVKLLIKCFPPPRKACFILSFLFILHFVLTQKKQKTLLHRLALLDMVAYNTLL